MPLTTKQEAFCLAYVGGMTQADAYRAAYDASKMSARAVQVEAGKLMANPDIALRVDNLRTVATRDLPYTVEDAMAEAKQALDLAMEKGNPGAAVSAIQLRARLKGHLVIKTEDVTDPIRKAMGNMKPEEAQRLLDTLDQVASIQAKAKQKA